ncbi:PREDICTED: protein E6-like [Tarenaya hassleriana]|uniref:protein E6-like n=1 Tax=Tarenaya hassleriana TaxID=28532 RepID=UPI00053C4EA0|nr:PREDICTED: protein E6-like [Tarenaya hassleriana]
MASFTRSFFFFFITISTLLLSTQIHARESYFFHKFQRDNAHDKNPSFVPLEANQKTTSVDVLPEKEEEQQGYGLYGHQTTYDNNEENPNYEPYNAQGLSQNEEYSYSKDKENYNNNNGKNYNSYNSNGYGGERSSEYNSYNNNNAERQGMSDTRFMENGKYYYDVNDENNHGDLYKKHYSRNPSYAVSNYDRFGQNNGERNSFQDPYNSKWEKNMMMNEQGQEEEFGEEQQDDQFVP